MTEILTRLTESEAIALVKQLAYVEVHPATDLIPGLILDAGEVIGYLDHPSLTIRHEDGTTKTWSAKLPMRVTDRPTSSPTPQHENVTVTLADLRAKVAFLTDQLVTRTAERDAAIAQLEDNHAVYIQSCEKSGAALLEYGAEIDLLRHRVDQLRGFLPALCEDAPDQPVLESAQAAGREWLAKLEVPA